MNLFNLYFHVKSLKEQSSDYLAGNAKTFSFDDTFIFVSPTTAKVYSDQITSLMTAANYEWQIRRSNALQQELALYADMSTESLENWDSHREKLVADLTANIIATQKMIIALIANYPQICGATTCVLPQAYATVSERVPVDQTIQNEQYYTDIANRIADSLGKLMACYLRTTAATIMQNGVVPEIEFVPKTPTQYSPAYDVQRFGRFSEWKYRLKHTVDSIYGPMSDNVETLVEKFGPHMMKLNKEFRRATINLLATQGNRTEKKKYRNVKLTFEHQVVCLFSNQSARESKRDLRSLEHRATQISLLCFMQTFAPDALREQCARDPELREVCEQVEGFVQSICAAMVHFYNTRTVTSTVNLSYRVPPTSTDAVGGRGNSTLSESVRMLNNVLVLGPLLQGMYDNCGSGYKK